MVSLSMFPTRTPLLASATERDTGESMDPKRRLAKHMAHPLQRMLADIARYNLNNFHFFHEILTKNNSKVESVASEATFQCSLSDQWPQGVQHPEWGQSKGGWGPSPLHGLARVSLSVVNAIDCVGV